MSKPGKAGRYCPTIFLTAALFLSLIGLSCQGGEEAAVNNANSTPEKKPDDVQENVNSMQKAGFTFIFAFRRPDEDVFTSDDKKYLKANSPADTNQWRLTEDGKAVIAGSHYKFFPKHLESLRKRFTVEDYSTPVDENPGKDSADENTGKNYSNMK